MAKLGEGVQGLTRVLGERKFLDGLPLKELRADRIPKRRQRRFKQFLLRTITDW